MTMGIYIFEPDILDMSKNICARHVVGIEQKVERQN